MSDAIERPRAGGVGRALAGPRRGVMELFRGLSFPFRGARYVYVEHPGLVRYWIVPIVVTALALAGSLGAALALHDDVTAAVWSSPAGEGWQHALLRALHGVLDVLVAIVLVIGALVVTVLVSGLVAAPFNARLAEVVDERVTGRAAPPFSLGRALGDLGRTSVIEITFFTINVAMLITSLVAPVVAPVVGVLGVIVTCLYFAVSYVEGPQASRGRSLGDRLRLVARHPMAMLGFGAGVALFLFVPIVNLLFMPAAVAGGVLFHATLDR